MVCHVSISFSSGGEEVADFHKFPEERLSPVYMYICIYVYLTQNKMNLFVLSGHGSESFAAFLNGVILQKNNAAVITAAVTTAQITR